MSGITFCIQCAMEDVVAGRPIQTYDESMANHLRRVHPDQAITVARRRELERLLADRYLDWDQDDPRRI